MAARDLYQVLGVNRTATAKEIKKVYRKLAAKYHPDKNNGDKESEKRFKEISAAYDVLGNPEKKKKYDMYGPNWEYYAKNGGDPGQARQYSRKAGGEDGWQHFNWQGAPAGDQGQWEDILKNIFGGGSQRRQSPFGAGKNPFGSMNFDGSQQFHDMAQKGADMEATLHISLEEAFEGTKTQILLEGQTIKVNIPPGAYTGQKLRLKGKGRPGMGGGKNGDLYLNISIKEHLLFRLEGLDLHLDLPVTPAEAAVGGQVTVPTLEGSVNLKIPPESNSGKVLRLKSMGMKDGRGNRGHLMVHLKLVLPDHLSDREKELYAQLGQVTTRNVREKLFFGMKGKKSKSREAA